jgi:hypothetical protein
LTFNLYFKTNIKFKEKFVILSSVVDPYPELDLAKMLKSIRIHNRGISNTVFIDSLPEVSEGNILCTLWPNSSITSQSLLRELSVATEPPDIIVITGIAVFLTNVVNPKLPLLYLF